MAYASAWKAHICKAEHNLRVIMMDKAAAGILLCLSLLTNRAGLHVHAWGL